MQAIASKLIARDKSEYRNISNPAVIFSHVYGFDAMIGTIISTHEPLIFCR
jgi:hypothetical protein